MPSKSTGRAKKDGARKRTSSQDETIFDVLHQEHEEVAALLDMIEDACEEEDFESARADFEEMSTKLFAHAKGEEMAVYPRFEEQEELADLTLEAKEEHKLVEDKLKELTALATEDPEWKAKLTVLKELVEHHVDDEEDELFPAAGKVFSKEQQIAMAQEFLAAKPDVAGVVEGDDEVQATAPH